MTVYQAGSPYTFVGDYYNEPGPSGMLVDPSGPIQVTISYGTTGTVVAGPFNYAGGSAPSPTAVYRISQGVYAFQWQIPYSAASGVYVATWQFTDGPDSTLYYGEENITVAANGVTPMPSSDIGYWTGSLTHPAAGVTVPFGAVDANGIAWLLLKVDGLDSAPSVGQVMQRAGDHGGYPTPQYYGPRPVTLTVQASAPTQALRDTARALMQQACPISGLAAFVYNEPVPKTLQVRRLAQARVTEQYPTLLDVIFSVPLIAPDPRKYGTQTYSISASATGQLLGITPPLTPPILLPAQPPPGSVVLVNHGNFETRPFITITGPIAAPALYNQTTGQTLSFSTLTLGSTDQLTVDLLNRTAYLNGAFRAADIYSSWWVLAPGTNQVVLQGSAATGSQMTVTYQDAWM